MKEFQCSEQSLISLGLLMEFVKALYCPVLSDEITGILSVNENGSTTTMPFYYNSIVIL